MSSIALIGNPNCGKTTIFNYLTCSKQKVGNWPGVTVERKDGLFKCNNSQVKITDLPGVYSLHNKADDAIDEKITKDFIHHNPDNIYVNIVNAANLERSLQLTLELLEMKRNCVIVLNMMDIADKQRIKINIKKLQQHLNCQIISLNAQDKESTKKFINSLSDIISNDSFYYTNSEYIDNLDFGSLLCKKNDCFVAEAPRNNEEDAEQTKLHHYKIIKQILNDTTSEPKYIENFNEKIDKFILHQYLGLPIFLLIIYLIFEISMNLGNIFKPFFEILSKAIFIDGTMQLASYFHIPQFFSNNIIAGFGLGINTVAGFIPQIALLFFFISLLEDSGYMSRAAFIMDRFMQIVGLPGKSFIPLIIGFGCNVPAIMATRHLNSPRDRIITSLMTPFMSTLR